MTATNQTAYVAVPEPSAKALAYYHSGYVLWGVDVLLGLAIPALWLFTGLSARLRDASRRIGRNWFFTIAVFAVAFVVISRAVELPLDFYRGFVRQHAYGLSNQTFAKWAGDWGKSTLVALVAVVVFLWVPYWLLKKSPSHWWLWTGLLVVPWLFFVTLIEPIWVAPLYNDFGPMKDKSLESKILALASRANIEGSRVFEVNKSVDTKTINAYVTGFLGTKRVVLWDTIIARLDEDELLFVLGHEMGHYVLNHVYKAILYGSVMTMICLFIAHHAARKLIGRFKNRWGFSELADVASLPLLLLLAGLVPILVEPIGNAYSRRVEHEADRFGLEITQNNRAAATAFVKLQLDNLANPRPGSLYVLWRADHPPLADRIGFCNEYRPWEKGEPLRYAPWFR